MDPSLILEVRDLVVSYGDAPPAVDHVSLRVSEGETLAIVGESGSGKSTIAAALMGLRMSEVQTSIAGTVLLRTKSGSIVDLLKAPAKQMCTIRGSEVAMIFQEPMSSLNPVHTIGSQIAEAICIHSNATAGAARKEAVALLDSLGISDAAAIAMRYPHELSGGMRQRVMIAIALSCKPKLLIADEPTTALDVTIQAQIMELLTELQQRTGMAMLFITHNLGLVAEIADRAAVLYGGRMVEVGATADIFNTPRMPYTQALLRSIPRMRGTVQDLYVLKGSVPAGDIRPGGCNFHPRCNAFRANQCAVQVPALENCGRGHTVACVRWKEIKMEAENVAV